MPASILFIFTSADKNLIGQNTGWWLSEAAHPYYDLAPHYKVTFAAPGGSNPPLDPLSIEMHKDDPDSIKFLTDESVQAKLAQALVLQDVKIQDYDAIFYVGGHGPCLDLATDPTNIKLLEDAVHHKKIISAVCHGPGALVGAQVTHHLKKHAIFYNKRITGFSNVEEKQFGKENTIPFLVEDRIKELGGLFETAANPSEAHVVVDDWLITGQNPASARGVGQELHKALSSKLQA